MATYLSHAIFELVCCVFFDWTRGLLQHLLWNLVNINTLCWAIILHALSSFAEKLPLELLDSCLGFDSWVLLLPLVPTLGHRYGGGGSPTVLSLLGSVVVRAQSTAVRNCFGQKCLDCEIRSADQELSLRAKNTKFMCKSFLLVGIWGPWTCVLGFVCWTGPRCGDQRLKRGLQNSSNKTQNDTEKASSLCVLIPLIATFQCIS